MSVTGSRSRDFRVSRFALWPWTDRARTWTGRGVDWGHIEESDREVKSDKTEQWPDLVATRSLYVCKHVRRKRKREISWKGDLRPKEEAMWVCVKEVRTQVFINAAIIHKHVRPPPRFWPLFDRRSEVAGRRSPPPPITALNSCAAVTTAWPAATPIRPAADGPGSWEKGQGTDAGADLSHTNNNSDS